jgi:aromatic ring-opening dioxygenase catalytic subunit (LigB family)
MTTRTLPTYFISHGGGPWPYMKDQLNGAYDRLETSLQAMAHELGGKPRAVLMVSAHWETPAFTVMATARPPMIYDYGGFPEHTYHVTYPAPGSPDVAERVRTLVADAGIAVRVDHERGFDHGMFSPMAIIYPQADVPVLQLSLKSGLDPREHLALGRALAPLRNEGVLIVGSGLSYHNLREFGSRARGASQAFDAWLQQAVVGSGSAERTRQLIEWEGAPSARKAHPREEHLLPLMVAVGAAEGEAAVCTYHEDNFMGGVAASSFRFGPV